MTLLKEPSPSQPSSYLRPRNVIKYYLMTSLLFANFFQYLYYFFDFVFTLSLNFQCNCKNTFSDIYFPVFFPNRLIFLYQFVMDFYFCLFSFPASTNNSCKQFKNFPKNRYSTMITKQRHVRFFERYNIVFYLIKRLMNFQLFYS